MNTATAVTDDDLQAFADDALPPARRAAVETYLERHPEAARYVQRIAAQNAGLRDAAAQFLEPDIPSALRVARLFERERARPRFQLGRFTSALRPQVAASLLAGLLIGGVGGWSFHPSGSPFRDGVRPLVEEAADTYTVYEPDRLHPVEIAASNKDALMRWTTNRLRRPVSAPDVIESYKLLGGRVVATSRGPAAMFMYENGGGQRIVLMICPLSLHGTAPITPSAQGDLTGVSWSDQGVGYSIVGALRGGELQRLGEAVRRQAADKA